jgi:hypothetical protein
VLTPHRIVLLALAAPIVAVGAVLWFLLPGSIAGITYTPRQFNREAHLQPTYWSHHRATIRGYVYRGCTQPICPEWLLLDQPLPKGRAVTRAEALLGVRVLPQDESGWHTSLRKIAPGLLTAPFPNGIVPGQRLTITGTLQSGYTGTGMPVIVPDGL